MAAHLRPVCPRAARRARKFLGEGGARLCSPACCRRAYATTPTPASSEKPPPAADWNQFISQIDDAPSPDPASPPFTLAVKDNIATLGATAPTTCASRMLRGYASPFEATIVAQLRRRGARLVGKTNLDEFGMGSHSVYSDWGAVAADTSSPLSVGGSSGGSAVAVRLGDADVALGTDTGGSVRLPAAYGGVVGFKPSYGMLSRFGVVPYANSLDTVGLLAPDVAPIRRLVVGGGGGGGEAGGSDGLDGLDGLWRESDTGRDPTSLTLASRLRLAAQREGYSGGSSSPPPSSLRGLTFGIPLEYSIAELDPRIRAAWAAAAARVRALGAAVVAVSLPTTRHALSAYYVLAPAEAASNLARFDGVRYGRDDSDGADQADNSDSSDGDSVLYERARGAGLGREVQRRILLGAYALSSAGRDNYFLQAQRVRRLVVRDFDAVFRLANPLRDPPRSGGFGAHEADEADEAGEADEADPAIDLCDLPEGLPLADKRGPAAVDFLLCPTAPTPAPRLADVAAAASPVAAYVNDVFTVPASLAGLPAISIPAPPASAEAEAGGPPAVAGLQLIGQFWDDARLLRVAETLLEASFARAEDRAALAQHRRTG